MPTLCNFSITSFATSFSSKRYKKFAAFKDTAAATIPREDRQQREARTKIAAVEGKERAMLWASHLPGPHPWGILGTARPDVVNLPKHQFNPKLRADSQVDGKTTTIVHV